MVVIVVRGEGVVREERSGLGGSDWMKVFFSTVGEKRTLFWRLIFGVVGWPFVRAEPLAVPLVWIVSSEWLDPLIMSSLVSGSEVSSWPVILRFR